MLLQESVILTLHFKIFWFYKSINVDFILKIKNLGGQSWISATKPQPPAQSTSTSTLRKLFPSCARISHAYLFNPFDIPFIFYSITWISAHCQALLFLNKILYPWFGMTSQDPPLAYSHLLLWHCLDLLLYFYCFLAKVDKTGKNRTNTCYYLVNSVPESQYSASPDSVHLVRYRRWLLFFKNWEAIWTRK